MRRPRTLILGTHGRALVVGGIALLVSASVARFDQPGYVVVHFSTDQFRHEYAAWAFLHIGPRVFDTPISEWHVHAAHPRADLWPTQPEWYPPGLLVLFIPIGVASNEGLLSDTRVAMAVVMMLGAAAVVAAFAFARALRLHYEPALALLLGALGAIMFVEWALNGFVDPLALRNGVNGERAIALVGAAVLLVTVALSERRLTPVACVGLALALVFGINEWEPWYPVLLTIDPLVQQRGQAVADRAQPYDLDCEEKDRKSALEPYRDALALIFDIARRDVRCRSFHSFSLPRRTDSCAGASARQGEAQWS